MNSFNRHLRLTYMLLIAGCWTVAQSCLPYRGFSRNKQSACLYFVTRAKTIVKQCSEGNYDHVASITVQGRYDSIKYISGKPTSFYPIAEYTRDLKFPFSLNTVMPTTSNEMTISIGTNSRGASYSLSVRKEDWRKDTLAFTYHYHK